MYFGLHFLEQYVVFCNHYSYARTLDTHLLSYWNSEDAIFGFFMLSETLTEWKADWSHENDALFFDVSQLPKGHGGRRGLGFQRGIWGLSCQKGLIVAEWILACVRACVCVCAHAYSRTKTETRQLKKERPVCLCRRPHHPMVLTYNNPQLAEHGSNLSREHTYYTIGIDISRPAKLVLVAPLWLVGQTSCMGNLLKEGCCMPCAIWIQPLGQYMSRSKRRYVG